MKYRNEIKIGLMVCAACGILAFLTFNAGPFNFQRQGYEMKILFKDLDGVNLNSPVMFNGYEVGRVEDVAIKEVDNDILMELTVWMKEDARLREGSKAYVKNLGFMGEKYVGLTSGKRGEPFLLPGSVLRGEEPPRFDKLVGDGQDIVDQLKEIVKNINERLTINKDKVDHILTNVDRATESTASVLKNADERLKVNEKNIDLILGNLQALSVHLEELTADLKLHPWKLLYRSKDKKAEGEKGEK